MSVALKAGGRVRVRDEKPPLHGYRIGDRGTVLKVLKDPDGGDTHFYVVAMDKNPVAGGMSFSEEEIEPDV